MKGLMGQHPSDMRRPGRASGPKQRGALDVIGVFQEIHVDEKKKKELFVLHLVVPNSRLSDTVGHVFLVMVSAYQVTFDGGSELGWLSAFQTAPRETFAPDLSTWKPVAAVKSSSNISIESTWSYDRQFNGRSLRDILEEGRIHLIPGNVVHSDRVRAEKKKPKKTEVDSGPLEAKSRGPSKKKFPASRPVWPKIVLIELVEFVDYFNNKRTRKQHKRKLPSDVAANVVFDMPGDYGLQNLAIPVTQAEDLGSSKMETLAGLLDLSKRFEEYIQNPTQRHTCQKSVNPTHPGKPARGSGNPTHSTASDTAFRKSDTIIRKSDTTPGNPTQRSAIVAWQWMPLLLIWSDDLICHLHPPSQFPLPRHRAMAELEALLMRLPDTVLEQFWDEASKAVKSRPKQSKTTTTDDMDLDGIEMASLSEVQVETAIQADPLEPENSLVSNEVSISEPNLDVDGEQDGEMISKGDLDVAGPRAVSVTTFAPSPVAPPTRRSSRKRGA
ncbi:hypothetical protein DFH08DRAFT_941178 [Mycena albidolilacea]|uniref:Uncharacterized protein n=1 Tax=Mycena albidolilacea TaxID=1033008 RepID=A0AAD6ZJK5_9AGAR|nr:hypothetical protein DFH08DRAFT_941178 [Mycena albidolilacea]